MNVTFMGGPGRRRVFLLADEEVLDEVARGAAKVKAKCVEVDYESARHDASTWRNTRAPPRRCFGWMRVDAEDVVCLW